MTVCAASLHSTNHETATNAWLSEAFVARIRRKRPVSSDFRLPRHHRKKRVLLLEGLEDRRLMAVDWRNPADSLDVNSDGVIVPQDALIVINRLNEHGAGLLPATKPQQDNFHDVSGDGVLVPLDALRVVNWLNDHGAGA